MAKKATTKAKAKAKPAAKKSRDMGYSSAAAGFEPRLGEDAVIELVQVDLQREHVGRVADFSV